MLNFKPDSRSTLRLHELTLYRAVCLEQIASARVLSRELSFGECRDPPGPQRDCQRTPLLICDRIEGKSTFSSHHWSAGSTEHEQPEWNAGAVAPAGQEEAKSYNRVFVRESSVQYVPRLERNEDADGWKGCIDDGHLEKVMEGGSPGCGR